MDSSEFEGKSLAIERLSAESLGRLGFDSEALFSSLNWDCNGSGTECEGGKEGEVGEEGDGGEKDGTGKEDEGITGQPQ